MAFLRHLRDHREGGEGYISGAAEKGHEIGDDRGIEADAFRMTTQQPFAHLHQQIHATGSLHGRNSRDDGKDDAQHIPGNTGGGIDRRAQHAEHDHSGSTGKGDAQAAQTGTQHDEDEYDCQLNEQHRCQFLCAVVSFFASAGSPRSSASKKLPV